MGSAYLCTRFRKRSGRRGGGRAPPLGEVTPGAGSRFGGSKKKVAKNLPVRKIRRNFAELFRRGFPEGFPATRKREHIDSFAITKTK